MKDLPAHDDESSAGVPIVCPFCPLHCDDVSFAPDGSVSVDCGRAETSWQATLEPQVTRVGSDEVSDDHLVNWFQNEFEGRPLAIVTRGVDLVSARVLQRLRSQGSIRLLTEQTPTESAIRTTVRRDGTFSATIGDVRTHADLIWSIGSPESRSPRLFSRIVAPDRDCRHIEWETAPANLLAELAIELFASSEKASPIDDSDSDQLHAGIASLRAALLASRYAAVVVGSDAFDALESTAAAAMLNSIVMRLNEQRRAVMLQLDPAATLQAVSAWMSNETVPAVIPANDPFGRKELAPPVVRLGDGLVQNVRSMPVDLQIGGIDPGVDGARAFAPASTYGIHQASAIIRGDGTVTLPLQCIASSQQPSPIQRLTSILQTKQEIEYAS